MATMVILVMIRTGTTSYQVEDWLDWKNGLITSLRLEHMYNLSGCCTIKFYSRMRKLASLQQNLTYIIDLAILAKSSNGCIFLAPLLW